MKALTTLLNTANILPTNKDNKKDTVIYIVDTLVKRFKLMMQYMFSTKFHISSNTSVLIKVPYITSSAI